MAGKSLLTYLGFRPNGHAQELEIVELNPAEHHITLRLPRGEVHNE